MKPLCNLGGLFTRTFVAMLLIAMAAPVHAATDWEIDQAIQDGLAWLATTQHPSGAFGYSYHLANTATAVLAFENEGHFPGGGTAYSSNVEDGLDYIFTRCYKTTIGMQTHGDPDTNGNGQGIYFNLNRYMYETGIVMQAIVASNTPNRVVTTGNCIGMTYLEVMQDVVDWLAWAQNENGTGRGGWDYSPNSWRGDNSVAQWPVLGLIAAEQWGIHAPAFVKDELNIWIEYIQNDFNGGSGYTHPTYLVNMSKTGGLLVEMYYVGDDKDTERAQDAINYLNSRWNVGLSGWYGNRGHPYAMFSVFKGLELMQVPVIPSAPANADTPAGDWWGDYSEYLVITQAAAGNWGGYYYWGTHLATPWYVVILQASVFPISVDIVVPSEACDETGYDVSVHYSVERFEADGTLTVYKNGEIYDEIVLTAFRGSESVEYVIDFEDVGSHEWRAVLEVTGGGIETMAEDTDTAMIYDTPDVSDIPNQTLPFEPFDLDDYQTCECAVVDWAAEDVPAGWIVDIDPDNVVTVTAPEGATEPAAITFVATFHWPGIDCTGSDVALFIPNQPPVAHPGKIYGDGEWYEVTEGGTVEVDASQSYDPDGDAITYAWDLDGDIVENFDWPGMTQEFSAAGLDGPEHLYIFLEVCDEHGACGHARARVEILNVPPVIEPINAPGEPVQIATEITASADFTDDGEPDTHTALWDWGDSSSSVGTVTQGIGGGSVADPHTYTEPGVYTITLTVTDDDGGSDTAIYQYVVVYDPDGGFVTGGGWIDSPAGAYVADPDLTGTANFGFVAKYKKGQSTPDGSTEFQFQAGDLNFHSQTYQWLVVAGPKATFKGDGTINGAGNFGFLLKAVDEKLTPSTDVDLFTIKIWDKDNGDAPVYDNSLGAGDDADPDNELGGGQIVIHKK